MNAISVEDVDGFARVVKFDKVFTPAMSIVDNYKYKIFENFRSLREGVFAEIDPKNILYFPHLLPIYRDEVVGKKIKELLKEFTEVEILSISYYPNPEIYSDLGDLKPKIVQVRNIVVRSSTRTMLNFFLALREFLPTETLIHIVSPIKWELIPFLLYVGVDIVDVSHFFLKTYRRSPENLIGWDAPIPIPLLDILDADTEERKTGLDRLNMGILDRLFQILRNAVRKGRLRDILEFYSHINQTTDATLAYLDNNYLQYFLKKIYIGKPKLITFVGFESFNRPIVKWYEERLRERYIPPTSKIVVLFPCAARKPYSFSKSHRLFKKALGAGGGGKLALIHEVMVTSPLGIVPRELEFSYPNAHYDTTTTGNWGVWEIEHSADMLVDYFRKAFNKGSVEKVLVHLDGGYLEAALRAFEKIGDIDYVITNAGKHVTEMEALEKLATELREAIKDIELDLETRKRRVVEEALAILSYQYGPKLAEKMLEDANVVGGLYTKQGFIIENRATFNKDFGLFIPLKKGAEILISEGKYFIEVDEVPKNNVILGKNVVDVDHENILGGDIIAISMDGEAVGVALAKMDGSWIKKSENSSVAKIIRVF